MSKDGVVRIGILSPTDAPSVSTVLEEMFQFLDGGISRRANYKTLARHIRLRLALMVFGDADYARLNTIMTPLPMVVPTAKLLALLELTRLTTDLPPLVLLPVERCISQPEARRQLQYTRAFRSAMANDMAKFLEAPAEMLKLAEMGHLLQGRASNGELIWSVSKKGEEFFRREEALEAEAVARRRPGIKKGLEVELEADSENIFLVREDQLPIRDELVEALEISNQELLDLFETATKLLAETDPDGRMRAYATKDATGQWQVELLPP